MKLRGLQFINIGLLAIVLIVGALLYINYKSPKTGDDIKSQLTEEKIEEKTDSAKPKKLKDIIAKNLAKQEEMVERKEFDDHLLIQERFYTENEINNMTESQFQELLKETELRFPKISDIKKLPPGALHRTPAPVMQAGKDLGLIKEILKVHESYERHAEKFYDDCAKNEERPTPVRALCLTNFIIIKQKNGEKVNMSKYPSQLRELTKMITDL